MNLRHKRILAFGVLMTLTFQAGCQVAGRTPFGFGAKRSTFGNSEIASGAQEQPLATTQQSSADTIAAQSRALSNQFAVPSNPELEKYASSPGADQATASSSLARRSAPAVSSSSGCSKGCCR